ncbi:MAG: UDP-N-acetylglucosamine 1-carboxyvinyltransferase [SAR324 cluster bacterium]|nr:UDP-N-acetylglucosamine 1-carboxyvinyltransferase [SAR324 cluster bacterium]
MDQFIVEGGFPLSGEITPTGNKNEALPVLATAILTREPVIFHNIPNIMDIQSMLELLESLGVQVTRTGAHTVKLHAQSISSNTPLFHQASLIRGSFLLAGPMLARYGSVHLPGPGGDTIGVRPVSTHLLALKNLGTEIELTGEGSYRMFTQGLKGADIYLDEASVTSTENTIMAAVTAQGNTTIYNAACEPHVQGICHCLNAMGAKILGIGSNTLFIEGVSHLHGCEYTIMPDHIEVGSFIGLAAVTRGELLIRNAGVKHLRMILMMFEKMGVECEIQDDDLFVSKNQKMEIRSDPFEGVAKIDDAPWPAFPSDLLSIMTVVATQCSGTVLIFEKMFESRLFWVDKLISMGAKIILCDPHRVVVTGPSPLVSAPLYSPDIRAGMALLIAALGAKGKSVMQNIHQIDRGYERIDERLQKLGAHIQRTQQV